MANDKNTEIAAAVPPPIIYEMQLQDTPNQINPNVTLTGPSPLAGNPVQDVVDATGPLQRGSIFRWFWSLDSHWIIVGAAGLSLLGFLIASHIHTPKPFVIPPANPPTTISPTAEAAALSKLNRQISSTTAPLKAAGYSKAAIKQAQNQVTLNYGTQIVLSAVPSENPSSTKPLYVTGANSPTHYANLIDINTNAYLGSLSAKPTIGQIKKNSAAVHGLTTAPAK